jgi:hypothetical protein
MLYPSKKLRFKGKLREGVDENDEVVVNDEEVKRWRTKTTADKNLQQQISEDIKEEKERKKKKKKEDGRKLGLRMTSPTNLSPFFFSSQGQRFSCNLLWWT